MVDRDNFSATGQVATWRGDEFGKRDEICAHVLYCTSHPTAVNHTASSRRPLFCRIHEKIRDGPIDFGVETAILPLEATTTMTAVATPVRDWAEYVHDEVVRGSPAVQAVSDLLRDAIRRKDVAEIGAWFGELERVCTTNRLRNALAELRSALSRAGMRFDR